MTRLSPDELDEAWAATQDDAAAGDLVARDTLRKYGSKPHHEEPLPPRDVDWM